MTHRIVIKSAQKEVDGLQFELATRLPYLTIVSPSGSRVLYKCVASNKRTPDGAHIYEHTENIGIQA